MFCFRNISLHIKIKLTTLSLYQHSRRRRSPSFPSTPAYSSHLPPLSPAFSSDSPPSHHGPCRYCRYCRSGPPRSSHKVKGIPDHNCCRSRSVFLLLPPGARGPAVRRIGAHVVPRHLDDLKYESKYKELRKKVKIVEEVRIHSICTPSAYFILTAVTKCRTMTSYMQRSSKRSTTSSGCDSNERELLPVIPLLSHHCQKLPTLEHGWPLDASFTHAPPVESGRSRPISTRTSSSVRSSPRLWHFN
jgi:hypothetical protein